VLARNAQVNPVLVLTSMLDVPGRPPFCHQFIPRDNPAFLRNYYLLMTPLSLFGWLFCLGNLAGLEQ